MNHELGSTVYKKKQRNKIMKLMTENQVKQQKHSIIHKTPVIMIKITTVPNDLYMYDVNTLYTRRKIRDTITGQMTSF